MNQNERLDYLAEQFAKEYDETVHEHITESLHWDATLNADGGMYG